MTGVTSLLAEGVTTVEIKSGYGLDTESEMKMLRVARRHGILAPETSLEQLEGLLATFSMCRHALERYRARPYPGKLTLFQTGEAGFAEDWRNLVDEIEVQEVPGDHYSMLSEPHLSHLSEQLSEVISHPQHQRT